MPHIKCYPIFNANLTNIDSLHSRKIKKKIYFCNFNKSLKVFFTFLVE